MRPTTFSLATALFLAFVTPVAAETASVRLAIDGGQQIVQTSSPRTDEATPFALASVGKLFTAVAILRLVERNVLDLDMASADLLAPPFAALLDGQEDVRLRHHLTMTSGLPDYYTDDWLEDALTNPDRFHNAESALRSAMEDRPLFRPGRDFNYSNTDYLILGLVLEAVTGKPYARVLDDEIFGPSGMADSFVFGSRALPADFAAGHEDRADLRRYYSGEGFGDGGVIASAEDLARFYQALFVERRLLSAQTLATLLHDPLEVGYGMGIEIEGRIVGHSGGDIGYSSDVRMDLESGALAISLVASEDADLNWTWERLGAD